MKKSLEHLSSTDGDRLPQQNQLYALPSPPQNVEDLLKSPEFLREHLEPFVKQIFKEEAKHAPPLMVIKNDEPSHLQADAKQEAEGPLNKKDQEEEEKESY